MKSPTPKQIRSVREKAGLTQTQAGLLVYVPLRTWQNWEAPVDSPSNRSMPPAIFELFKIKITDL